MTKSVTQPTAGTAVAPPARTTVARVLTWESAWVVMGALGLPFVTALWVLIEFVSEGEVFALWGPVAGLLGRYAFGYAIGHSLVGVMLPRYLLHGATRRSFLRQAPLVGTALAAGGAVVVGAGWLVERAVFRLAGWPYALSTGADESFFGFLGQVAAGGLYTFMLQQPWTGVWRVVVVHWLVFTLWAALGALLTAGFARGRLVGLGCVPVSLALLAVAEPGISLPVPLPLPPPVVALVIGWLLAWAFVWVLVARAPLRVDPA
ncbi:MAG: hypothetical protein WD250_03915 [Egibacteraceae bacterium]